MKKLSVFVSCFAVLLVLSNVSFAQEEVVVEDTPCTCCAAHAAAPLPFAYPPYYPAPHAFGGKLAALKSRCALAKAPVFPPPAVFPPQAMPLPAPLPQAYAGYPYGAPAMGPFAARRAARLAAQSFAPQPFVPQPFVGVPPVAPVAPPAFVPAPDAAGMVGFPQLPVNTMGSGNKVYQRASVGGAPVINFMSVVRAPYPQHPYAGYYQGYPSPYAYPQPVVE